LSDARPQIVLVSGLSGSGKSTAMSALEDIAFYCVDNLPVPLVEIFLGLCRKTTPPVERIALAVDAREGPFLGAATGVPALARALRASGAALQLIFLDCANDVLVARYRETRRVHPLAPAGPVEEGIERERRLLVEVASLADHVIDTSSLNVHQLRAAVVARISGSARPTVVNLVSFGFRHPAPPSAELLFDVRFLPNPYFEEALRERSGSDPDVAKFVLDHPIGQALCARLLDLLGFLLPLYDDEGKSYLTVGIGCTGGRHRSVAVANALAEPLRRSGREVNVEHRDAERSR
jgi:UPF0042 nucleotide-binding protein